MNPLDLSIHLLNFLAPTAFVAILVSLVARFLMPKSFGAGSWWTQVAINCIAGGVTLVAGLWYFGRDGKMATYAALVLACATSQWLASRAWR